MMSGHTTRCRRVSARLRRMVSITIMAMLLTRICSFCCRSPLRNPSFLWLDTHLSGTT